MDESTYQAWYEQSIQYPDIFWDTHAKKLISWQKPYETVLTGNFAEQPIEWFTRGKLNAAENCLDRHLKTAADKIAIIWQGDEPNDFKQLTYQQLHLEVCKFANVLKSLNIKLHDRVCIYLPMIPEAAIAMLACARIGAVHSVVFGGFSPESLKMRINDAKCKLVITANEGLRGGKKIPLKENVDAAVSSCQSVQKVIVVKRTDQSVAWDEERDIWYHDAMREADTICEPAVLDANDPHFILYTSGSTGKPKGILHTIGGYMVFAAMTFKYIFDYQPQDIFWCTADVGWITGHTYGIYGPLSQGATTVMFEGVPTYPTPARFWQEIDKHHISIFYTAPTAIRALRREGDQWLATSKRDSLRLLGSVGEPINPEAWLWYFDMVGKKNCPIVDTWWQTETGGIMISPIPTATPLKPGAASWPFFGVLPQIVDDNGNAVLDGTMGNLVITQPWPGMMQTVYGDPERFQQNYFATFPGKYLTGDQAHRDQDGYFWIAGRSDDVIKVSGHRIGTEEVESALILHPAVSEAAVVGVPDDIKGQTIYAFVCLKSGMKASDKLKDELVQLVRKEIGAIAAIAAIQWAEGLPKTRSGKIMRRLLRKIATNDTSDLGDLSTLADPDVVTNLIKERIDIYT